MKMLYSQSKKRNMQNSAYAKDYGDPDLVHEKSDFVRKSCDKENRPHSETIIDMSSPKQRQNGTKNHGNHSILRI